MNQRVPRVRRHHHLLITFATAVGSCAGFTVADQHRHRHPSGRGHAIADVMVDVQALLLLGPLRFVSVILEPDLHLGGR